MPSTAELLSQAKALHKAGQLSAAAPLYRQILQADASHVEAWFLLGISCQGVGDFDQAVASFERAARLNPAPEIAAHLRQAQVLQQHAQAGTLLAAGNLDGAAECYRRIVELEPELAEAHGNLGALLERQDKLDEAAASNQRAIALKPDFAAAHYNLASVRERQRRYDEAATGYRQAIDLAPEFVDAHLNLGTLLEKQDKLAEAADFCRGVILRWPELSAAHNNLAAVLARQDKLDEAAAACRRALELDPQFAAAHNNLAGILLDQYRLAEAEASCRRAIELEPKSAEAQNTLAGIFSKRLQLDAAEACCRRALELKPAFVEGHYNLALILLTAGQFAEGWTEYEWRWKRRGSAEPAPPAALWAGEDLTGRTIILRTEQGLGDALQFIRYASLVKQRGAKVIVEVQPPLLVLAASCSGVDAVVAAGAPLPRCDFYVPLLSLPRILGTLPSTIPADVPYLAPDESALDSWKSELAREAGFKIGIAWQGNPSHPEDRRRSMPLVQFAPLARVAGVRLYSLQAGAGREQLPTAGLPIVDLGDRLGDFSQTAAIVGNLDLIIACDSSAAHLAGALGVPVWVALAYAPDWRWMLRRSDSPWYPTMRLFRQAVPGDWQSVFDEMARQLKQLM